jgi:hypothetical protein
VKLGICEVGVYKAPFCLSAPTFLHHRRVCVLSKNEKWLSHVASGFRETSNGDVMFASSLLLCAREVSERSIMCLLAKSAVRLHGPGTVGPKKRNISVTCASCRLAESPWSRESIPAAL